MTDPDIESYFTIEPVEEGQLETPVPVVDLDLVARDVRRWEDRCDALGPAARAGREVGREIEVLVECDTGACRFGVPPPAEAAEVARIIDRTEGIRYRGLMNYRAPATRAATASFLSEARERTAAAGLDTWVIGFAGSPEMWSDTHLDIVTEYRAGTYVCFDRALNRDGACMLDDCALKARATVVSVPAPGRAILDAGSKAQTSNLIGLTYYGCAPALSDARVYLVNEEHGDLDVSSAAAEPEVGDLVDILPNHACPVSNLFDRIAPACRGRVLGLTCVDARGLVW